MAQRPSAKKSWRAIGLMSGTSLDGVDAALLTTDGEAEVETGPWCTLPYDADARHLLGAVIDGEGDIAAAEAALRSLHVAAVRGLLGQAGFEAHDIDVVGFPGQTIEHRPEEGITRQIGDGKALARELGIDVVDDFRSADVAAGGEGAPLAPLYHAALARDLERPIGVLNIGGVANLTWIGAGDDPEILAFDTGPGGAMLDDWIRDQTGRGFDRDGEFAAAGKIAEGALARLLDDPYFERQPPKSLDRNAFSRAPIERLSPADGAATLTAFTAAAVDRALAFCPIPPHRLLVTGGGRHNPVLMHQIAQRSGLPVEPVETAGWQGDALEAQAFAYLAVRSRRGLPISLPTTTGVPQPLTGGRLNRPGRRKASKRSGRLSLAS